MPRRWAISAKTWSRKRGHDPCGRHAIDVDVVRATSRRVSSLVMRAAPRTPSKPLRPQARACRRCADVVRSAVALRIIVGSVAGMVWKQQFMLSVTIRRTVGREYRRRVLANGPDPLGDVPQDVDPPICGVGGCRDARIALGSSDSGHHDELRRRRSRLFRHPSTAATSRRPGQL